MTASDHGRCAIEIEPGRTITLVPSENAEHLNDQQRADYKEYRDSFINWVRTRGKNPEKYEGYSDYTAYETAYRCARFDRWIWQREGRYTVPPTPDHATAYIQKDVVPREVSNSTKGKTEEAVARQMRWVATAYGVREWDHDQVFKSGGGDAPRDYLTRRERRLIRDAALDMGDSWETTSLVLTSLDAGLRPVQVGRARPEWVDVDNMLLRIPKEDSSKNVDNWRVSLTSRTKNALNEWLDERADIKKYDGRDELWLTRNATRWGSRSLSRLMDRLADAAGIDSGGRQLTWYSIRHSTATYLVEQRDLKAAKDQLRHQSAQTTLKYDQVPADQRRDALEKM